ncbi:MAG TPA: protein-glutamate O-methyltransferase CheR [Paucimonas sp.]|nr:protein-glutamate O-methyltransferase CheR [Paucimonas sp.]
MSSAQGMIEAPDRTMDLAARIETETGLSFPAAKRHDLMLAVAKMARLQAFADTRSCVDWLLGGPWTTQKTELCARYLTVRETYFFREPRALDLVCDYARRHLEQFRAAGRKLCIWSAGCCTGEEPYSIAMTLLDRVPELGPERISILGTDLNSDNLEIARVGTYRQWSFRGPKPPLKSRHFSETDDGLFRISDQVREMVNFAELNLAKPVFPSPATRTQAVDIIFCRNVLMYFSRAQTAAAIDRFRQCLVEGGLLIVGVSEASFERFPGFSPHCRPDVVCFRKNVPGEEGKLHPASAPDGAAEKPAGVRRMSAPASDSGRGPAGRLPRVTAQPPKMPGRKAARLDAGPTTEQEAIAHAHALANAGDAAAAMRVLDQQLQAGDQSAALYRAKAIVAMEAGNDMEASRNLKRVLYLQPDCILAHYWMGALHALRNRRHDAVRHFKAVADLLAALRDDTPVPGSDVSVACLRQSVDAYLNRKE